MVAAEGNDEQYWWLSILRIDSFFNFFGGCGAMFHATHSQEDLTAACAGVKRNEVRSMNHQAWKEQPKEAKHTIRIPRRGADQHPWGGLPTYSRNTSADQAVRILNGVAPSSGGPTRPRLLPPTLRCLFFLFFQYKLE